MSKIKIKQIDNQLVIKVKLEKQEEINQKDIDIFNIKQIRGITRPKVLKNRKLEYLIPGNISLQEYLKRGVTKNEFFVVFAQFIECVKKAERNEFDVNNFLLDCQYIFFNTFTKEVQFIYLPVINCAKKVNLFSFIYQLLDLTVIASEENTGFLNDLTMFVKSMQTFSPLEFEQYIIRVYPQVYKQVRRSKPGDSQYLKHTGWNYYEEKYHSTDDSQKAAVTNESEDGTLLLSEEDDFEETGLLTEDENLDQTDLLLEEDDLEATGLLTDEEEEGTTVLANNEGTSLYTRKTITYPYLIRLNNYEKVSINKPVFRIGKEKSYVDYFVMSNNAVSRVHADILTENGRYFIKDNNSTNHTFVNGTMIPENEKIEIFDGDALMLANEPFEFHKD